MKFFIGGMLLLAVFTSIPQKIEYVAGAGNPVVLQETLPETVEEKIVWYAERYGPDPSTMLRICKAESGLRNVPNYLYTDESGRYTAYGICQITRTTYRTYCGEDVSERMDVDKNIECAMIIASTSGLHHWNESRANWN